MCLITPFKCVPTQGTFNEEPTQRTFTHFHNESAQAQGDPTHRTFTTHII